MKFSWAQMFTCACALPLLTACVSLEAPSARACSQEQALLQLSSARASVMRDSVARGRENMTIGATASCSPEQVSRRRRAETMCSCRRRSGPSCKDAAVSLETPAESSPVIKVMSYNLMGWNTFNAMKWRGENVMDKIEAWNPDVLGCQEVETGGGHGYDEVREAVEAGTSMSHSGGGQFFKGGSLEKLSEDYTNLMGGYWMSMTRYQHKASGMSFLFFNSHWMHGYGTEQASIVASFIDDRRKEFGNLPAVLVGDTNQFCRGYERSAWKYLKGEQGSSPIIFEDVLQHDQGKSFSDYRNPDCRVDLIFVSKGDWIVRQSDVDRDGMGDDEWASDHAALMAELIPIKK